MNGRRIFGPCDPYLAPPFRDDPSDPGNDPYWDRDPLRVAIVCESCRQVTDRLTMSGVCDTCASDARDAAYDEDEREVDE